jgi:hypothetical protein
MEVTMQWWDMADDLWYASRLRLAALQHLCLPALRGLLVIAAAALLTLP